MDPVTLADYISIIKYPVDITKIENKLNKKEYKSLSRFIKDLNLVWENCMQFNLESS